MAVLKQSMVRKICGTDVFSLKRKSDGAMNGECGDDKMIS